MLKKQKAALQATKILHQYGIRDVPVDVETLCKELGVKVETELLDDDTSGVIIMKNDRAVIGVNRNHHPNRQRFTIAHELGHFILHKNEQEVFVDRRLYRDSHSATGEDIFEIEANTFAAEILMPEAIIYQYIETEIDLYDEVLIRNLARKFGVSEQAFTIRLMNLGFEKKD